MRTVAMALAATARHASPSAATSPRSSSPSSSFTRMRIA